MYIIWQDLRGWHISRKDGHLDEHSQARLSKEAAVEYCDTNGLDYEIFPLDVEPVQNCQDTFEYEKEK